MLFRLFNIDQDEHDAGGGAGGAEANQPAGISEAAAGARAAEGAGAPEAQAGANIDAVKPEAGQPGQTNQAAAEEQHDIVWNGQKVKMSLQELKDNAQRAYNVTQGEQANSKTRKELAAAMKRFEDLIAEAEKNGKQPAAEEGEQEDPVMKLSKEVDGLRTKALLQDWEKAFNPVQAKYPDISEKALLQEFQEKVKAGEVEDTSAGLMKTAEGISTEREGTVNKRVDALLTNTNDPRVKAFTQKVIADYVAGKLKLANAGGENPKGASGGKAEERSISEIAADLRQKG